MSDKILMELKSISVMRMNEPNINGHIYTEDVVRSALKDISELYGQLDYPDGGDFSGLTPTTLISHVASNFTIEDEALSADIAVLNTPCGKQLADMISVIRFAPRGVGIVDRSGNISDYKILAIDAISD